MADCFIVRRGGRGGGITLKPNAVSSAEALPTTAKSGDIYIITQTALTGVSYFQPEEPVGTFTTGDVWILTSEKSSATVNVAKKGSILIGLKMAYVWDGSQWTQVDLYVWGEDDWVDIAYYLISAGNVNVDFTASKANITENSGYLNVKANSGSSGYYRTTDSIDLSAYSTIYLRASNSGTSAAYLCVWDGNGTRSGSTKIGSSVGTISLDVSEKNENYMVGIFGMNQSSGTTIFNVNAYELWME